MGIEQQKTSVSVHRGLPEKGIISSKFSVKVESERV